MHQAAVVQRKITTMARMRLVMGMSLEGIAAAERRIAAKVSIVKYFLL
jgi:hypothetical protein